MSPTKMEAKAIKSRCDSVRKAIEHADGCTDRVKKMLCTSLALTVGTPKADRHPFNERFVTMIEQVLHAEQAHLSRGVAAQEAAFAEISPAKATREAAVEQAKAAAAERGEALGAAKNAVTDGASHLNAARIALRHSVKEQNHSLFNIGTITGKKTSLENTVSANLAPIVEGIPKETASNVKDPRVTNILKIAGAFGLDSSLMSTAGQVLEKPIAERGGFDATCLQELQEAFTREIAKLDEQLAAEAPGQAELAAAVEQNKGKLQAAEACSAEFKQKAAEAKEAKEAADGASKAAAKSLADFMPDLKAAGDSFDHAKTALQHFIEGPLAQFSQLKDFKEGDFKPVRPIKKVEDAVADADANHDAAQAAPEESPSKRARTE